VISEIDDAIRQVRSTIYELGAADIDRGVRVNILAVVREVDPVVGFEVPVLFDGPVDSAVSGEIAEHLLATVREALTNIGRHAEATSANLTLSVDNGMCRLEVVDNGRGLGATDTAAGGLGLVNLRRRAEKLRGTFVIESPPTGGTRLSWQVPLAE